jgi:hypothetical protein
MKLRLNKSLLIGLIIALIACLILWIYNSSFKAQELPIQIGLYVMYGLLLVAIIAALALFSKGFQWSGLSSISLYIMSLLLLLLLLGYMLDTGEITPGYLKYGIDTVFESKCVGAVVFTSKIMVLLSALTAILASIRAFIKQ